ncbi:hypothetical protein KSS87_008626 [Heliosperma pusillum]|nr:hypothetical protein KSS87_008626 [Heliosperma pusillum]
MATTISAQIRNKTLINPQITTQIRNFARWTPYKPSPKSKLHQNLRTIKTLKSHLQNSYLVSPFPCHGFSANQFKSLKSPLSSDPTAAKIVVVKNKLVSMALRGTQWEKLSPCMKGMNSLLFVKKEELVGPALTGVKAKVKEGKMEFNEFTGGVIDGMLFGHLDLKVLESSPSRDEANGMILQSVFGPSSTLMAVLEGIGCDDVAAEGAGQGEGESKVGGEGEGATAAA